MLLFSNGCASKWHPPLQPFIPRKVGEYEITCVARAIDMPQFFPKQPFVKDNGMVKN
jgi:hypothetical protein